MYLLVILLTIIIAILVVLLLMQRRTMQDTERAFRHMVPAYVDATLALTTSVRNIEFILALVPAPPKEQQSASNAELEEAVTQAMALNHKANVRFAPITPLRRPQ